MQLAFGLVNSSLTGGDRTGTLSTASNTFHTVEVNYFANVSGSFGGPTLSPFVAGAQKGGGSTFNNFASIFGPDADLGDNEAPSITELPQAASLQASMIYTGGSKTLELLMYAVNPDGSLSLLSTEVPPLSLGSSASYDTALPFLVDSLAIMAYKDGFTTAVVPSLEGSMTFQSIAFTNVIPEPATYLLIGLGAFVIFCCRGRSHA
jgi:hypothetical protein